MNVATLMRSSTKSALAVVLATALGVGPADDHELLAVEALRLDPKAAIARRVGSIGPLGDDAFEAELAGLFAEARATAGNVFAVAQSRNRLPEQALQALLALDQRQGRGAFAIQVQQVEGEEDQLVRAAFVHRRLEPAERRRAVGIKRAKLAIEIGRLHGQRAQRLDRSPIATRPVQAGAGQQPDLAAVDAGVHAVAVVLDLVQPFLARRRFVDEARELRLDPFRRTQCRCQDGNGQLDL